MKITVDVDEQLGKRIDLEASKDGHSNRNAVIRKVLTLFFDNKVNYGQPNITQDNHHETKGNTP